jgi:predicted N-acetyltransferase YhbS
VTSDIIIRPLTPEDDVEHLTDLLHRAYAPLAEAGMRFLAFDQTVEETRQRVRNGRCLVAEREGVIVGTILLVYPPGSVKHPILGRPDVMEFGQFAVAPLLQRRGIGAQLVASVEAIARLEHAARLVLVTAEPALALRNYYQNLGFHIIAFAEWPGTNCFKVVMEKALDGAGG